MSKQNDSNDRADDRFEVYKGLQAPLMFKGFKGRYIYIGGAVVIFGFIVSAAVLTSVGMIFGIVALVLIWGAGFVVISRMQKKGLHTKDRSKGIYMVVNKYHIRKLEGYADKEKENRI